MPFAAAQLPFAVICSRGGAAQSRGSSRDAGFDRGRRLEIKPGGQWETNDISQLVAHEDFNTMHNTVQYLNNTKF